MVLVEHEVWVAVGPGEEVLALLAIDGSWLDQLYVDPDRTSRGIGAELLGVAKDRRPQGLQLWTFEANHGARYEWLPREAERYSAPPPSTRRAWPVR